MLINKCNKRRVDAIPWTSGRGKINEHLIIFIHFLFSRLMTVGFMLFNHEVSYRVRHVRPL